MSPPHRHAHAFSHFNPLVREGLTLLSRRNMMKASLAGLAGLTVPDLLRRRARAAPAGRPAPDRKSVILLWMTGGPSHIDTWDPKPSRPPENRGPFGVTRTRLPGVLVCEHLPKMAAALDRFTLIRSVDCRHSNHEPNRVMQTANADAEPRLSRAGHLYPAFGSVIAKVRGPNHPALPPYVTFLRSRSHVAGGGYLGQSYDPFVGRGALLVTTFTSLAFETVLAQAEARKPDDPQAWPKDKLERWRAARDRIDREQRQKELGVWMIRSTDGGVTWSARYDCLVHSPHGYDRSLFLAHGLDPRQFDLVVVKSPHCQPHMYADWCARLINVDAPGSTSANLPTLGHTRCRRPIFPLDGDVPFTPQVRLFSRQSKP